METSLEWTLDLPTHVFFIAAAPSLQVFYSLLVTCHSLAFTGSQHSRASS